MAREARVGALQSSFPWTEAKISRQRPAILPNGHDDERVNWLILRMHQDGKNTVRDLPDAAMSCENARYVGALPPALTAARLGLAEDDWGL